MKKSNFTATLFYDEKINNHVFRIDIPLIESVSNDKIFTITREDYKKVKNFIDYFLACENKIDFDNFHKICEKMNFIPSI